jgi:hypothetical protein
MPLPSDPQTFFLGGLFALSGLAALYVASSIILPVVLAFVFNLLLQPAVRLLERLRLPRAAGALVAILLIIGALVGLVAALSGPAETWAKRLPEGIPVRHDLLLVFGRGFPNCDRPSCGALGRGLPLVRSRRAVFCGSVFRPPSQTATLAQLG